MDPIQKLIVNTQGILTEYGREVAEEATLPTLPRAGKSVGENPETSRDKWYVAGQIESDNIYRMSKIQNALTSVVEAVHKGANVGSEVEKHDILASFQLTTTRDVFVLAETVKKMEISAQNRATACFREALKWQEIINNEKE